MPHTHHPDGQGPVCSFKTKRECDANWSAHQKAVKDAYQQLQRDRVFARSQAREQAYQTFTAGEQERIRTGGSPV